MLPALLPAVARAAATGPPAGLWSSSASFSPLYLGAAKIAGGGTYTSRLGAVRIGTMAALNRQTRLGLTVSGSYADNRFSAATQAAQPPWGDVQRFGLALPVMVVGSDGWRYLLTPSVDVSREAGADTGDALIFGAVVAASKSFATGQSLGIGVGGFDQIDTARFFVYPVIDWAFSDRWRLCNPLTAGPTGPAGLELDYRLAEHWELGLGGAYRQLHFRLRDDGAASGGIGTESGTLAFLHLATQMNDRLNLHLYAGALLAGKLEVEERTAAGFSRGLDPAPLCAAMVRFSF